MYDHEYLPDSAFTDTRWQKSSRSEPQPNCVELTEVAGVIGVRDSKMPHRGTLQFDKTEFAAFLTAAKDGEFDHFTS